MKRCCFVIVLQTESHRTEWITVSNVIYTLLSYLLVIYQCC